MDISNREKTEILWKGQCLIHVDEFPIIDFDADWKLALSLACSAACLFACQRTLDCPRSSLGLGRHLHPQTDRSVRYWPRRTPSDAEVSKRPMKV